MLRNKIFKIENLWWFGLFLILLFFHSNHPLDSDEGVTLNGAWNLINSRELFIDFFEFYPPASFYLIFWLWKIFGVHYFIAKFFAIVIVFSSSIGIYKISQIISKNKFNYIPPIIFIIASIYWPIINHNTFNILFIIWAVYFFLKGLSDYSSKNFLISGLLTGLSILFLQQKGVILFFSLLSFLLILFFKEKKYQLLKLNFYFLLFSFLPLLILLKWPLKILYENLIIFPLFNYAEINRLPLYLFTFFLTILLSMIWLLRNEKSKKIWLLFYIQFFLLLTTIVRSDFYHTSLIVFPLCIILALSLERIKFLKFFLKNCYYLIIGLTVFILIYPSIITMAYFSPFYSIKDSRIISFIKNNCEGKYLWAGPFIPGIYFETKKLNPTPYSLLITRFNTERQFLEIKGIIRTNRPSCAVLNYQIVDKFNYNKNNPVDNYIRENYKLILRDGNTLIYKKN